MAYRLLLKGQQGTVNILNRFYFQSAGVGTPGWYDLASQFGSDILNAYILPATSANVTYTSIEVENLSDPLDFGVFPLVGAVGAVAGDALPSFNSVAMLLARNRTDVRSGGKRFSGIAESQAQNGNLSSSALTAWQAVASALFAPLEGLDDVYHHGYLAKQEGSTAILFVSRPSVIVRSRIAHQVSRYAPVS